MIVNYCEDEKIVQLMDKAAKENGMNRSSFVRLCVREKLSKYNTVEVQVVA
jgi:metal-responsive CopG/Arc/MetJ family transcriptional regulator